jgi:hypothetical protein
MATLYVTEYAGIGGDHIQIPLEPAIAQQTVAIGGSSTPSAAFNPATRLVRLNTDATCSVAFGTAPTAVATAQRLPVNSTEYFAVYAGYKVAVITNT